MSQWTHIRGGLEFSGRPYEREETGDPKKPRLRLPFPEEQVTLLPPEAGIRSRPDGSKHAVLEFSSVVWSFPRCKPIIDRAAKAFLPHGEGMLEYSLARPQSHLGSSGNYFHFEDSEAEFKRQIREAYREPLTGTLWSFEQLEEWNGIELQSEYISPRILFTVRDDVRYCSADDMTLSLERFLFFLHGMGIDVEDGYLEWEDEYDPRHRYAFRNSRIKFSDDGAFLVLDAKTNLVVASKTLHREFVDDDPAGYLQVVITTDETSNWKDFFPNDDIVPGSVELPEADPIEDGAEEEPDR